MANKMLSNDDGLGGGSKPSTPSVSNNGFRSRPLITAPRIGRYFQKYDPETGQPYNVPKHALDEAKQVRRIKDSRRDEQLPEYDPWWFSWWR